MPRRARSRPCATAIARLGVKIERRLDGDGDMVGDPEQLRRVFGNLVGNALDAMEEAHTATPTLVLATGRNLAGTDVWVSIRDNGPGIDAAPARARVRAVLHVDARTARGSAWP